jgi:hypothetical protein
MSSILHPATTPETGLDSISIWARYILQVRSQHIIRDQVWHNHGSVKIHKLGTTFDNRHAGFCREETAQWSVLEHGCIHLDHYPTQRAGRD